MRIRQTPSRWTHDAPAQVASQCTQAILTKAGSVSMRAASNSFLALDLMTSRLQEAAARWTVNVKSLSQSRSDGASTRVDSSPWQARVVLPDEQSAISQNQPVPACAQDISFPDKARRGLDALHASVCRIWDATHSDSASRLVVSRRCRLSSRCCRLSWPGTQAKCIKAWRPDAIPDWP